MSFLIASSIFLQEVAAAIEGGCNIIPVMDNFEWPVPEDLPEDMRPVCYFNAIRWVATSSVHWAMNKMAAILQIFSVAFYSTNITVTS